jgi:2-C-methyl-D-erythritol 4-phosphate cytidylyltransferase / 2-C-methyl-D-erythritol 2,4-cyclodiphosphate synthase
VPEVLGDHENGFADAVIVAAGASTRMGGTDKSAERILDRSMLEWSIDAMAGASSVRRVVVVTRAEQVETLAATLSGVIVVAGGAERSHSVRNGVAATTAEVVLVHDAARPLATPALADRVAAAAAEYGAAVPVVPVVDSLKRAAGDRIESNVDRSGMVRTQTPQGARRELLIDAFAAAGGATYTDEAALLESRGVTVATVAGEPTNIKVTEPADLEVVRAIAAARAGDGPPSATRIGLGQDTHGFGPHLGMRLGGVTFDDAPRLFGHSDGDVVLHALATAILSAANLGDLGRIFPPSDRKTVGIASSELVAEALKQANQAGWSVANAQIALVGARPKLRARGIDAMRARVAQILDIDVHAVGISASTGNLYGAEGAGRAISATCLVGVHRR